MELSKVGLQDRAQWEAKGYKLPQFDREAVTAATKENPFWIHFGAGNIFRAFQANVMQNILNEGLMDRGIVVAEGFDYEIVEKMNLSYNDYNNQIKIFNDADFLSEEIKFADGNSIITVGRYKYTIVCNSYTITFFCDKI